METNAESEKRPHATPPFRYFDPQDSIENLSGNLPHWRQTNVVYFVTFRLGDSLPQEKLQQWTRERDQWLAAHPEPHTADERDEYFRLFPERFHGWLDEGFGECILAQPEPRQIVTNALKHFAQVRYTLDEFIIMPNHVHVLVSPLHKQELSEILHSWKSFSSHAIGKALGRRGQIWQKKSFDHIVRNGMQMERIRRYIRENPKK